LLKNQPSRNRKIDHFSIRAIREIRG
jgi:hypothetical protein